MEFPVDVPSTSTYPLEPNHKSQVIPLDNSIAIVLQLIQVYLNGSIGDEDTLVRVKHRREKSNSVGGAATIAVTPPNIMNGPIRRLRVRRSVRRFQMKILNLNTFSTASSTTTEGEEGASNEAGDSDEDDDGSVPSHESYVDLKDCVREALEKEPSERNSEDISVLMVNLEIFSNSEFGKSRNS